jgi:hypothetical protein
VRVVGRVAGASGGQVAIEANANQILDEADTAYVSFLSAAREFSARGAGDDLAGDQPADRAGPPATVGEAGSLDLAQGAHRPRPRTPPACGR